MDKATKATRLGAPRGEDDFGRRRGAQQGRHLPSRNCNKSQFFKLPIHGVLEAELWRKKQKEEKNPKKTRFFEE